MGCNSPSALGGMESHCDPFLDHCGPGIFVFFFFGRHTVSAYPAHSALSTMLYVEFCSEK